MITTRSFMNQIWTDLNSPTEEEIDSLILTENISAVTGKDLLTPTPLQKSEDDGQYLYAVLHIPVSRHSHQTSESNVQEIDFLISLKGVITARYDSVDALHYFAKKIEVDEILNKKEESHIFFEMMKGIYQGIKDELYYLDDWMTEIEKNIFSGREKEMVFSISSTSRNLLNFKKNLDPHGQIMEFIKKDGGRKFGRHFELEAEKLIEDWKQIREKIVSQIEMANELRETNNSLLSTKQNEIMKQLAAIGMVILPLTIIGQLFGLSIHKFPLVDSPYAFWMILGIMATVMVISLIFAKIKKWM